MNKVSVWMMALFYTLAGCFHFLNPGVYMQFMPPYLPWHKSLIYISGFLEITFGILLLFVATRRIASYFIIALLIAIFPANVHMALEYTRNSHPYYVLALLRLPVQFALIRWAWSVGKVKHLQILSD